MASAVCNMFQRASFLAVCTAVLGLTACSSAVREVKVSLEGTLIENGRATQPIEVDVIGVNTLDGGVTYSAETVDKYFERGSAMRQNARKHTFRFDPQTPGVSRSLTKSGQGPWREWSQGKANQLVVMVTGLPNRSQRFLTVPFDTERWPEGVARFVVRDSGVAAGAADTND